jgi:uncharacterized protein involved in tellurium resistance
VVCGRLDVQRITFVSIQKLTIYFFIYQGIVSAVKTVEIVSDRM